MCKVSLNAHNMSTFNGLVAEIEGISIDRFDDENLKSRAFFLSHCHTDHMRGLYNIYDSLLRDSNDLYIYTSDVSRLILNNMYPELKPFIRPIRINDPQTITIPSGKTDDLIQKYITVVLIPAGHCPGSVMFLMETSDGTRILYTGDFRFSSDNLSKLHHLNNPDRTAKSIDKLYFDSTFWDEKYLRFPDREESCEAVCKLIKKWISKSSDHVVVLNTPANYGCEFLYMEIYKRLKMPIHVRENVNSTYSCIIDMDRSVTLTGSETQIHSCHTLNKDLDRLNCRDQDPKLKIRIIRISAMMWTFFDPELSTVYKRDPDNRNKYYVCYSSHCSQEELKDFIRYFKPRKLEPCVVPMKETSAFNKSINDFHLELTKQVCIDTNESKEESSLLNKSISFSKNYFLKENEKTERNKKSILARLIDRNDESPVLRKRINLL